MIRYVASLTLHFAEQEEGWVDATTGLPLSERMLRARFGCGQHAGRRCDAERQRRLGHAR